MKNYYEQYCNILTNVIREAKNSMYQNQIINYNSKIKTAWNIIKSVSVRQNEHKLVNTKILWTPLINSFYQ